MDLEDSIQKSLDRSEAHKVNHGAFSAGLATRFFNDHLYLGGFGEASHRFSDHFSGFARADAFINPFVERSLDGSVQLGARLRW